MNQDGWTDHTQIPDFSRNKQTYLQLWCYFLTEVACVCARWGPIEILRGSQSKEKREGLAAGKRILQQPQGRRL